MTFRADIQALRGFAVLIILLFHAGIGPFTAGFLGVDIFFVISGFLITSLLMRGIEAGSFSFKDFYFRRAKRLLPAAYVTLLLTAIGSYFFLTAGDFNDFKNQMLGALTFSANVTLLHQSGYFDGISKIKPLLHMWSLSLEEQFYMILPLALFFTPARFWKMAALLAVIASLIGCWLVYEHSPDAAFFYLPTRAWELGLGALGALYIGHARVQQSARLLFWPALLMMVALPIFPLSEVHPGIDAVLVCLATLIVILRGLPDGIWLKPLAKLGDYSYSLYLVHWPLFAFATSAYLGREAPVEVRAGLLALSLVLAFLLYHLVENPLHRMQPARRRPFVIAFVLAAVGIMGLTLTLKETYTDAKLYKEIRRANVGLGDVCEQNDDYKAFEQCQTGGKPEILVWGDSHAMHLVPGVVAVAGERGVLQATRSACAPLVGLSFYNYPKKTLEWGESCLRFNDQVLEKLQQTPSIKLVILSGAFGGVGDLTNAGLERAADGSIVPASLSPDLTVRHMAETVDKIRALGRRVILISSPPRSNYNIGSCLERQLTGKLSFGPNKDCRVPMTAARALPPETDGLYLRFPQEAGLDVIHLADGLCDKDECKIRLNGKWIYRDVGHLAYEGSEEIFKEFNLLQQIDRKAR
jgi:peptidoglycan/LPS O-acetylase OafA/YrhL